MHELIFFSSFKNNRKGFTLLELLVVMAIIAVLAAVAVPMLHGHLEKARNVVDVSNAKMIARTVQTYLVCNTDSMDEFISVYGADPRAYRPYILVTDTVLAVSSDKTGILKEALAEAGLLGEEIRDERYNGVLCKTQDSWQSYTIGFTVIDGELVIGFCGQTDKLMQVKRWTEWSGADPTPFRSMYIAAAS